MSTSGPGVEAQYETISNTVAVTGQLLTYQRALLIAIPIFKMRYKSSIVFVNLIVQK